MSRILELVDTSSAVYAGSFNQYAYIPGPIKNTPQGYREQMIPMGGVNQLFNLIAHHKTGGTMVFCCDRTPTEKRKKFEQYKSGRSANHNIQVQKGIAEYVLKDCGFEVAYADGYEADDVIYSSVKKFKNQYDHVYIYTADSDLYFLVDENVSVLPPHSRAKEVTYGNYSYVVNKDIVTRYNAMPLIKLFKGDPSKGVPPIRDDLKSYLLTVIANDQHYPKMGDKEFFRGCLETLCPEVLWNYDLLAPMEVALPEEYLAPNDDNKLRGWAKAIKHKLIRGKDIDLKDNIAEMFSLGLYVEQ